MPCVVFIINFFFFFCWASFGLEYLILVFHEQISFVRLMILHYISLVCKCLILAQNATYWYWMLYIVIAITLYHSWSTLWGIYEAPCFHALQSLWGLRFFRVFNPPYWGPLQSLYIVIGMKCPDLHRNIMFASPTSMGVGEIPPFFSKSK